MTCDVPDGAGVICRCVKEETEYYLCVLGNAAGKWSFPKGHLDMEETAESCATRELKEETGIEIQLGGDEEVFTGRYIYYIVVFQETMKPVIHDQNEIRCAEWISLRSLLGKDPHMLNADLRSFLDTLKPDDGFETVRSKKRPLARCRHSSGIDSSASCRNFNTDKGCRFGNKCRFAHVARLD